MQEEHGPAVRWPGGRAREGQSVARAMLRVRIDGTFLHRPSGGPGGRRHGHELRYARVAHGLVATSASGLARAQPPRCVVARRSDGRPPGNAVRATPPGPRGVRRGIRKASAPARRRTLPAPGRTGRHGGLATRAHAEQDVVLAISPSLSSRRCAKRLGQLEGEPWSGPGCPRRRPVALSGRAAPPTGWCASQPGSLRRRAGRTWSASLIGTKRGLGHRSSAGHGLRCLAAGVRGDRRRSSRKGPASWPR